VTEYHQAGGDVRAWVMAVVGDDGRFPLRVVIPPDEAMRCRAARFRPKISR